MKNEQLQLAGIYLKDFRCFNQTTIDLDSKIILIFGLNGAGKTSLLEGLYYGCYLRSFRTHLSRDLISLGKQAFFLKISVKHVIDNNVVDTTIQVGFSQNKRLVKINNQTATSYKDLLSYYRVVSLTEDDLKLIQGSPEERRNFLNQAIVIFEPSFISTLREYKVILDNRNALLQKDSIDYETYYVWTKKLWECTNTIQDTRKSFLYSLEKDIRILLNHYIDPDLFLSFQYQAKKSNENSFDGFWEKNNINLLHQEKIFKRTLFGAHLDDFSIVLEGKKSRAYASRGQQKMILLLLKLAQIKQLIGLYGPIIFLLDDFMTDFDKQRSKALLSALFELNCQLIFTSPRADSALEQELLAQKIPHKIISI